MARQERNSVDYFPFICKEGKAMFYIENKYSNDGFATWIKILRQLAVTNHHFLNLSNNVDLMFLAAKCRVSEVTLKSIIDDLSELGEFNKDLWVENSIIWSDKFIENIKDAYKKRNNKCITYSELLVLLDSLGIRKLSKSNLKVSDNTHSKEEYNKVKKIKVFTPPTIDEVRVFCKEKGYIQDLADRAFNHYDLGEWKDTNGNKVKNWKQKISTNWFKDEFKITENTLLFSKQERESSKW